ncbi:MAG TPA: DinB family protein [Actinomycetota bacterium]
MLPVPDLPPEPPTAGAEKEMLTAFLDHERGVLRRKVSGLSEQDLRRRSTVSSITLLGLLKHEAYVERWWFRRLFAGEDVDFPWTDEDPDADFRPEPEERPERILALYDAEVARAREIVDGAALDDVTAVHPRRGPVTMRWILLHMIEEVSRHLGHADVIREAIDGATGD